MPRLHLITLAAVLVALSACSLARKPEEDPSVGVREIVLSGSPSEAEVPEIARPGSTTGVFVIAVTDQKGKSVSSISVEAQGPVRLEARTDAKGLARFEGPVGNYQFEIRTGCSNGILVEYGETGRGTIVAGATGRGELRTEWRHRIAPGGGSYPSLFPYWPVGEIVDLTYDIIDRCLDDKAAGGSFPTFRFHPSPNITLEGIPVMKANDNGMALVRVKCTAEGDIVIIVRDSRNPKDEVDIAAFMAGPGPPGTKIVCRNSR